MTRKISEKTLSRIRENPEEAGEYYEGIREHLKENKLDKDAAIPMIKEICGGEINDYLADHLADLATFEEPDFDDLDGEELTGGIVDLDGEGFFVDVGQWLTGKYPGEKATGEFLKKYGSEKINSITVYRRPLNTFLKYATNILTQGKLVEAAKQYSYDKLFHLFVVINNKFVTEKNETVNASDKVPKDLDKLNTPETKMPIPVNKSLTVGELFENSRKKIGDKHFFSYAPLSWNCQDFIQELLDASGLSNPTIRQFIVQNVEGIAKELPKYTNPLFTTITDFAALAKQAVEKFKSFFKGKGLNEQPTYDWSKEVLSGSGLPTPDALNSSPQYQAASAVEKAAMWEQFLKDHPGFFRKKFAGDFDSISKHFAKPVTKGAGVIEDRIKEAQDSLQRYNDYVSKARPVPGIHILPQDQFIQLPDDKQNELVTSFSNGDIIWDEYQRSGAAAAEAAKEDALKAEYAEHIFSGSDEYNKYTDAAEANQIPIEKILSEEQFDHLNNDNQRQALIKNPGASDTFLSSQKDFDSQRIKQLFNEYISFGSKIVGFEPESKEDFLDLSLPDAEKLTTQIYQHYQQLVTAWNAAVKAHNDRSLAQQIADGFKLGFAPFAKPIEALANVIAPESGDAIDLAFKLLPTSGITESGITNVGSVGYDENNTATKIGDKVGQVINSVSGGRISFPEGTSSIVKFNTIFKELKAAGWNYKDPFDKQLEQLKKIIADKGLFWLGDRYRVMWQEDRLMEEMGQGNGILQNRLNRLVLTIRLLPAEEQEYLLRVARITARLGEDEDEAVGEETGNGINVKEGALNGYKTSLPEKERREILKKDCQGSRGAIEKTIKRVNFVANFNKGEVSEIAKKDLKWLEKMLDKYDDDAEYHWNHF